MVFKFLTDFQGSHAKEATITLVIVAVMFALLIGITAVGIACCVIQRKRQKESESPQVVVKGYKPTEDSKEWLAFSKRTKDKYPEGEIKPLRNLSEESDLSRSMVIRSVSEDVFTSRSGNHSYA